ncbi:MAG: hypothetical protein V2A70_05235 [Candidatus Omnitrophota bacterium]
MRQSKGLCYLSGIDRVFYVLDQLSKKATGCGNASQVILCLDRSLDAGEIRQQLSAFARLFPVIHAVCVRAWNLAPFWSYPEKTLEDIPFESMTALSDEAAMASLHACVNQPFMHARMHLRMVQVTVGDHAFVSLVFDHRLLDARGAQSFLRLFHQFSSGTFSLPQPFRPERPSGLSLWKEKFMAGQRVNRRFVDLAGHGAVEHLPVPRELNGRKFVFRTLTFDRVQSERMTEQAYDTAGYLMMAPYLLAVSAVAFKEIFAKNLSEGENFVVPVNTDIRSRNPGLPELFFNHLSFFFLRFLSKDIALTRSFISQVSRSMYEAMSGGFAQDLAQATLLLRVVPSFLTDTVQRALLRVKGLTFSFSYVNKGYEGVEFSGAQVKGVVHTPRVAVTPGVGIFFTQFNGCISLTFSFLEGLVTEQAADLFIDKVRTFFDERDFSEKK